MKHIAAIIMTISLFAAIPLAEDGFTVSGVGAYPISAGMTSMWLAAPDHHPLVMAYFQGPNGWHDTQWKVDSKFEKGKPGWAELRSETTTLRLSMDTETGEVEVQSRKFKVTESNTFLILHMGEPSTAQKIVPLGVYNLLPSAGQPASILLLKAHPELAQRLNEEVAASQGRSK